MTDAANVYKELADQVRQKFTSNNGNNNVVTLGSMNMQAIVLAEETGEALRAYRRATGQGRVAGSWFDVEEELADVIISAQVLAAMVDIDLDRAVTRKLTKVLLRGIK